jgi:hypothetical protein
MKESGTIRDRGVWSADRNAIEVGRANGQKKLRSVNKNRALAARYGFYKYPKWGKGGKTGNAE